MEEAFNAPTSSSATGQLSCGPSRFASPAWTDLDRLGLGYHFTSVEQKNLRRNADSPTELNRIDIWFDACKYLNIDQSWSRFGPIWRNANFKPGGCVPGFQWAEKRSGRWKKCTEKMMYSCPFQKYQPNITTQRCISLNTFKSGILYRHLKINHWAIMRHCFDKSLTSSLYDLLMSWSDEFLKHKLKLWMEDKGTEMYAYIHDPSQKHPWHTTAYASVWKWNPSGKTLLIWLIKY